MRALEPATSGGGDPLGRVSRTYAFTTAFVEELGAAGVRHVCISPGSRSTPLTVAAVRHAAIRCWSHVDERAGAFFALGLARASRSPVALVCTSGTAAANMLPAVVEAHYARVPLIVLTADRPPELREWGAGQTIDQIRLFGSHVRWFADVATPDAPAVPARHARALAGRAVAEALASPAGPVHLNLPFREPLHPAPTAGERVEVQPPRGSGAWLQVSPAAPPRLAADAQALEAVVAAHERGVVVCGPDDADDALATGAVRLARAAGWPILAEATSQLRRGPHVPGAPLLAAFDHVLRHPGLAGEHAPEVVVQIGATPTSKPFRRWLERERPAELVLLDPDRRWPDPSHWASRALHSDPAWLCETVAARTPGRSGGAWRARLLEADRLAAGAVARLVEGARTLLEPRVVRELAAATPAGGVLYASNSMPVRHLDAHLPIASDALRVLCNRGANGIDGVTSSALGAAAANVGAVALLTGDLAFLHDVGGLMALRRHGLRAVLVVLNDDGGGIFSRLPIARSAAGDGSTGGVGDVGFDEHFRTPHGLDLGHAARLFGAGYERVTRPPELRAALEKAFAAPGATVVEVPIDPDASLAHQHEVESAARRAVDSVLGSA